VIRFRRPSLDGAGADVVTVGGTTHRLLPFVSNYYLVFVISAIGRLQRGVVERGRIAQVNNLLLDYLPPSSERLQLQKNFSSVA